MGIFSNKVVGIFSDRVVMDYLLNELNTMGYERGDISVLAKDHSPVRNKDVPLSSNDKALIENNHYDEKYDVVDKDPDSMLKGAAVGGTLGLLTGLGLLLIPGIGPILATGPIIGALTAATAGAAVGATAGTLLGLLKDEGVPHDYAEKYEEHFENGDILVFVGAEASQVTTLKEVFTKHNAISIDNF